MINKTCFLQRYRDREEYNICNGGKYWILLDNASLNKTIGSHIVSLHLLIQLYLIQVIKIPWGISRLDYVTSCTNSPDLLLGIRNLLQTAKLKRHTCTGEITALNQQMTVHPARWPRKKKKNSGENGKLIAKIVVYSA